MSQPCCRCKEIVPDNFHYVVSGNIYHWHCRMNDAMEFDSELSALQARCEKAESGVRVCEEILCDAYANHEKRQKELEADLAAAQDNIKFMGETTLALAQQRDGVCAALSETQAKLEEARIQKAVYEKWAEIKFRQQEKVIERATKLLRMIIEDKLVAPGYEDTIKAFLGQIGK